MLEHDPRMRESQERFNRWWNDANEIERRRYEEIVARQESIAIMMLMIIVLMLVLFAIILDRIS